MAESRGIHRLKSFRFSSPDAVPLAALLIGAVSFFAPFAAVKENRVVDGVPVVGAALASPTVVVAAVAAALVILAAATVTVSPQMRQFAYAGAGIACFWIAAALLAASSMMAVEGAAPRASPAWGFWGLPAASYVLLDHSRIAKKRGAGWILALVLLLPAGLLLSGGRGEAVSVVREWTAQRSRFGAEFLAHLRLFASAVAAAGLIGIPAATAASRSDRIASGLIAFVDAVQAVPSMALFGLLMAPLAALSRAVPVLRDLGIRGIGAAPALTALTLYALLPVVRNTIVGLATVPVSTIRAGLGMGMSRRQLMRKVKWPLALPHVLTGLRTASVQAVGNTAVAALIGAGGLGVLVFQGLGQAAPDLVLLGVLPLIALAVIVDRGWGIVLRQAVSAGLRNREEQPA